MKWYTFFYRNFVYYRLSHLWILMGTILSTTIIIGAMGVGDSLRYSLAKIAFQRLAKVEYALFLPDRFVQIRLAQEIEKKANTPVSYALQLKSFAKSELAQANSVHLWCVEPGFWKQNLDMSMSPEEGQAILNPKLALHLGLKEGDSFLLRIEKASFFPKESSFSARGQDILPLRLKVQKIDTESGDLSLRIHQIAPYNVFVSYSWLARKLQLSGYANAFLAKGRQGLSLEEMNRILEECFQLQDMGIEIKHNVQKTHLYLKSPRVFLEKPLAEAALQADARAQGILTYFVNQIQKGEKSTPYSFLCATGEPLVPSEMGQGEILVNQWLAHDLSLQPGDNVQISYFSPGDLREMKENRASFVIKGILPLDARTIVPDLMPDFPGLASSENCRDWNAGIAIDFSKIRPKDEEYWKQYKGTPKGFISLSAAQKLWANRYGNLTAICYPEQSKEDILLRIRKQVSARDFGLAFSPVQKLALEASAQGVDFAQLFLALSFFLVVSALLLIGLLFYWHIENRFQENANLMALGLFPSEIRNLFLYEAVVLSLSGVLAGMFLGMLYTKAILYALTHLWYEAVRTRQLFFQIQLSTLVWGCLSSFGMIFATIFWTARRFSLSPKEEGEKGYMSFLPETSPKKRLWTFAFFSLCLLSVAGLFLFSSQDSIASFFIAGALMLSACLLFCYFLLLCIPQFSAKTSIFLYIIKNYLRQKGRSLTTIALLSSSLFLVVTVAANRPNTDIFASERNSGTGGYTLWCETSLPLFYHPDSQEGRQEIGLSKGQDIEILALRAQEGDDASCFNINRAKQPSIMGLPISLLAKHKAFSFVSIEDKSMLENPWPLLEQRISADTIPAFADYNTILWGLGKKIGDKIEYQDEKGKTFYVQLTAAMSDSILQGQILVSERFFLELFPSHSGIKKMLLRISPDNTNQIRTAIASSLEDYGIEILLTKDRLNEFQSVPNTYLTIFLTLGGLGILLGICGLAILVKKNILDRSKDIRILYSLGFQDKEILSFFLLEHLFLVVVAILCALLSCLVALFPNIAFSYHKIPWPWIFTLLSGIFATAFFSLFLSIRSILKNVCDKGLSMLS